MFIDNVRKKGFLKLETIYFAKSADVYKSNADIALFYFCQQPVPKARRFNSVHIDLAKTEEQLFADLRDSNRREIRKCESKWGLKFNLIEKPTLYDVHIFSEGYNDFALCKGINKCDDLFLKRFLEQNRLIISQVKDSGDTVLCSIAIILDEGRAYEPYGYSNFRKASSAEQRRIIGAGNKYLHWKEIVSLKQMGFKIYDLGGLSLGEEDSDLESVDHFKLGFGGEIVTEYHFYKPYTFPGWISDKLIRKKIAY